MTVLLKASLFITLKADLLLHRSELIGYTFTEQSLETIQHEQQKKQRPSNQSNSNTTAKSQKCNASKTSIKQGTPMYCMWQGYNGGFM